MPVLLQIGTNNNKNIVNVARALSGVPCHLRIIGRLSKAQIAQLDNSKISYSSVSNLTDSEILTEYIQSDALIFASTYEGFGMPIVEAQATGRPVLTSNVMSMPEVAGDAACLVDPLDVNDIRRGVLTVINDERFRNELVEKGYSNAQRFRPEIIARQYAEIYKEIFNRNAV
jgi:glycosyltransferase involved in cell wall biosynthesis